MADCPENFRPQDSCKSRLIIPVYDTEDADLLQHFPRAIAFIQGALTSGGKVLVHCAAGVSRSATVRTPRSPCLLSCAVSTSRACPCPVIHSCGMLRGPLGKL